MRRQIPIVIGVTAVGLASALAQLPTGTLADNKLAAGTGTFYVNPPPDTVPPENFNNTKTESLGVAITSTGNVVIGWEDDGDGLTDFEAVWTLYDTTGKSISPNVDIVSQETCGGGYAGLSINSKFMSFFRADKSPVPAYPGWGPKIKANPFGAGFGMGGSYWALGCEIPEQMAYHDAPGADSDDYPVVQLLTDAGVPTAIANGADPAYLQRSGSIRIADWEYLSNGNIVIVGESRQNDDLVNIYGGATAGRHAIYRIVTQAGAEVKAVSLVGATPTPCEIWHGVGVTANGFAVRFASGGVATVRLFKNDGTPITDNIDVGAVTGNPVAAQGGRGDGVGFHGNGADAYVITAAGADPLGVPQVWVTVLNATDGSVRFSKAVAGDVELTSIGGTDAALHAKGQVFVIWAAKIVNDPNPYLPSYIMGRMLDATGTPIGGTFFVSEQEGETVAAIFNSDAPRVSVRGDSFAAVWRSQNDPVAFGTKIVGGRLFGILFKPGSAESIGLTRIVPDTVIPETADGRLPSMAAKGNWEPYTSVLGTTTFLIEGNTFALNADGSEDTANQRFVVALQPAAGGAMKLGEVFHTDAGQPYRMAINASRQNGNPGRVAGDKRPGGTNFMAGAEASPHFDAWKALFNSDGRWDLGFDRLVDGRYGTVQTYSLDPTTLVQTMRSKAQDSAHGRDASGASAGNQVSRFGGELACLDNGNFVSVVQDNSRTLAPNDAAVATIFTPDGSVVKEAWVVGLATGSDIWSNVAAYKGGFAIRCKPEDGSATRWIYFFDNAGNLKGHVDQAASGRAYDTGRGDGTRIAGHINGPYVFLVGSLGGTAHSVPLSAFDSRDFSYVTTFEVTEAGFEATADRVGLAVDALNRVVVSWTSQPTGYNKSQVAARVLAFNEGTKTIGPLTPSFWAFINNNPTNNIRSLQMNPSMTTKQILIAAKGEVNLQNKPENDANSTTEVNFYTVISHPNPQDDPTTPVGGDTTPPTLTVSLAGTTLTIAWPTASTGFTLESKNALTDATWTAVGTANPTVITIGTTGNKFYRLRK